LKKNVIKKMNKFYVYRHIRLDTNTPFYVGKGHTRRAFKKYGRNEYWTNIVNRFNYKVEIVLNNLSEDEAWKKERMLIKLYKTFNLCEANITLGGEGACGLITSIATKNKLSKAMKGMYIGKVHTLQSRQNMSLGSIGQLPHNKGIKCNNEMKEKLSIAHGGKLFNVYTTICIEKPIPRLGKSGVYIKDKLVGSYINQKEAANALQINQSDINLCLKNNNKSIKGYLFEYEKLENK